MKFRTLTALIALGCCLTNKAEVKFDDVFADSTLRIDYVLSGTPGNVGINLRHMHKYPKWGGRTTNLEQLHYLGNGDITMTTLEGDTIYRNSFSSLFNEWLDLGESVPTICQSPQLLPFPKEKVVVTIRLLDKHHQPVCSTTHTVDPTDILIRDNKSVSPHRYLKKGSWPGAHVGIAFLGEGYKQSEMEQFYLDAQQAMDAILSHEPFAEMQERLDFVAIETPSVDSGVSVPKNNDWRNSSFKSHYSTFYSDRYLTSPEVFAMYDALNCIPAQHVIVLVNTEEYGGGGIFNAYTLTSARHPTARPVVVHEFGHSFGGLADEYFNNTSDAIADTYPIDVEPWEPNITTLVDFDSKWKKMVAKDTPIPTLPADSDKYPVGIYEGGGYSAKGVYRPADYCRMRVNEVDGFCPVCQKALRDLIIYYTE